MTRMLKARQATAATLACALIGLTSACNGGDPEANDPTETPTPTAPTAEPTAEPTEDETPAWAAEYTDDEIQIYESALQRFERYEEVAEPIWREGKASPQTAEFFERWWLNPQSQQRLLQTYEQANVAIEGNVTVLDSRPTRIVATDDGQSVTIRQCVDYSSRTLLQGGEQAPGAPDGPRVRRIQVDRFVGDRETPWMLTEIEAFEGERACRG